MRIVCASDLHGNRVVLPSGDILVLAGDYDVDDFASWKEFKDWIESLNYRHIVIVGGNHDFYMEKMGKKFISFSNANYLESDSVIVDGIKFYGEPRQPRFYDWAWNVDRGAAIAKYWEAIPEDTNVLITHGPPMTVLDTTLRGDMVGCEDLLRRTLRLKQLKLHVFGHIHPGYGQEEHNGVRYVNAAICDETYNPINPPIVVDI